MQQIIRLTESDLHNIIEKAVNKIVEEINIDPKNKGKFTATQKKTGKSTEELCHSKNPLTRKRANFAKMAKRHWKPLVKEARGYVPNDGNSMVGGHYDSWDASGTQNIATLYKSTFDDIAYEAGLDEMTFNAVNEYIDSNEDVFDITAYFDVSYDESTGYGNKYNPVYNMTKIDKDDLDDIKNFLSEFQGDENVKSLLFNALDKTLQDVDEEDFDVNDYGDEGF